MNVAQLFEHWRYIIRPEQSWGLAWYLAYEFCRRYYSSHGIAPMVNSHDGLGYYGILIESVPCKINGYQPTYGRMTAGGDVENWRRSGPGGDRLETMEMCSNKIPTQEIVRQAIAHMGIDPIPSVTHLNCRHKRWGGSYELCFEIATILALRNESRGLQVWNHPYHTEKILREIDPKWDMKEHLGAFLFVQNGRKLLLAADGRLLDNSGVNVWHSFMNGYSATYLADMLEERIGQQQKK